MRAARLQKRTENSHAAINRAVAGLLSRFETVVLRVWRIEARKIQRFNGLLHRALARFRLGPFADVFFIWKYFTLAVGAMYLPHARG